MSTCRTASCGADIEWATNVETGRRMPYDPGSDVPVDSPGAVIVWEGKCGSFRQAAAHFAEKYGTSIQHAETVIRDRMTGHTSHFATCPGAAEHRK